jgi:hypothetical protein
MENKSKRNAFNIILLIAYILLTVIFPILALSLVLFDEDISDYGFINGLWRFTFIFMSLPVYGIYAVKMITTYFPKINSKAVWIVLPAVATILVYAIKPEANLTEMLILSAFPMFIGFYTLLLLRALGIILFKRSKNTDKTPDNTKFAVKVKAVLFALVLFALLLFPAAAFSIIGFEMNTNNLQDYEAIAKFVFSIALFMYFHYRVFTRVLDEGYLKR